MDDILELLRGDRDPGLYRIPPDLETDALLAICEEEGWQLFAFDGETISSKSDFLKACAIAMKFPDHFGYNWDAFNDCLTDLDWITAKGYLILYTQPEPFAKTNPTDWATLLELLQDAVDDWAETDTPMAILFNTQSSLLNDLEEL
jgi:hypothetical protein